MFASSTPLQVEPADRNRVSAAGNGQNLGRPYLASGPLYLSLRAASAGRSFSDADRANGRPGHPVPACIIGNGVEWRCIGNFPALIRHDRVTGHASRLSEPFAGFGIGRKDHRRYQQRESQSKRVESAMKLLRQYRRKRNCSPARTRISLNRNLGFGAAIAHTAALLQR
jgi:hypothetical protein